MTENHSEMREKRLRQWQEIKARMVAREQRTSDFEKSPLSSSFHAQWTVQNRAFLCNAWWNEEGFDPNYTRFPKYVGLLVATAYSKAIIESEGLYGYFVNICGYYAPEVIECLEVLELNELAEILSEATGIFGLPFPRSREARILVANSSQEFLKDLTSRFYSKLREFGDDKFNNACDNLLRRTIEIDGRPVKKHSPNDK